MNLDLSDDKTAALTANITGNIRYSFSERIRMLKAILATLGPRIGPRAVAVAEGTPPRRATGARRRRWGELGKTE
jgi:hypothetical protein